MSSKVLDSSVWLSYLCEPSWSDTLGPYFADPAKVIVPTLVLFEVYRKLKRTRGEPDALLATAQMGKCRIVPLDDTQALNAADVSLKHGLAMADAIIYATTLATRAALVTRDNDFRRLPGVTVLEPSQIRP